MARPVFRQRFPDDIVALETVRALRPTILRALDGMLVVDGPRARPKSMEYEGRRAVGAHEVRRSWLYRMQADAEPAVDLAVVQRALNELNHIPLEAAGAIVTSVRVEDAYETDVSTLLTLTATVTTP